jgi:hypothetical protein
MKSRTTLVLTLVMAGAFAALLALSPGGSPSHALAPLDLTPTAEPPTPTPGPPCVSGKKIDDLHVGLPNWIIHARPCGQAQPVLTTATDGNGNFRFDPLAAGCWTIWEEQQPGWAPVTSWTFDVEAMPGYACVDVRFKNRQSCAEDLYESDNSPQQARVASVNGPSRKHTLEPPSDQDWIVFEALAGWTYVLRTADLIGATDTVLTLYDTDGETVIAISDDATPGSRHSQITWRAPVSGSYFAQVRDLYQTGLNGCLGYQWLLIAPGQPIYLPIILAEAVVQ